LFFAAGLVQQLDAGKSWIILAAFVEVSLFLASISLYVATLRYLYSLNDK
jgi:hypothetical protein